MQKRFRCISNVQFMIHLEKSLLSFGCALLLKPTIAQNRDITSSKTKIVFYTQLSLIILDLSRHLAASTLEPFSHSSRCSLTVRILSRWSMAGMFTSKTLRLAERAGNAAFNR